MQVIVLSLLTLGLGAVGAFLADVIGMPAPYLVGPAAFVTVAGLCGLPLMVAVPLRNLCFLIVGLSMGASVSPDVLNAARAWPFSFVMVFVTSVVLLTAAYVMLQRLFRYDPVTAILAACPGHLSYVLSLAAGLKSDLPSVSLIQSIRVLALTLCVPLIVELGGAVSPIISMPASMGLGSLFAMGVIGFALGAGFHRLKVPAALLVGGMATSIVAHVTGLVSGVIPLWIQTPVYIAIGAMIGTRFAGVSLRDIRKALVAGALVTVLVAAISAAIAAFMAQLTGVPLGATMIAFAPGGLETMAAMAVIMRADPTYVGTHHILRLIFLSFLMPFVIRRFVRTREGT
ncbi:AbrB family transcriptional regulator [Rhizobium oryzicola]|uniref:AbrB family transcriptional regulator n=1 Tax=Rhizobium oryzicola TaxID=1232668 RepID=A0ABT8SRN4_9HYPH|nr:AbrB family transcriptional regulator [Rhizobium oryzicola]MDO1581087.1 AbrB family transcriptional regulator [Rhizobium oryzicola]